VIVVDASVILHLIAAREPLDNREVLEADASWMAPSHVDVEVLNALRRYVLLKKLTVSQATTAVADYLELAIERYPLQFLIPRIWQLRANFSAYDAAYVAAAEVLSVPFLTRDRRLASAAGHHATVIPI
jgi:predicted nucleic acid-binding protein